MTEEQENPLSRAIEHSTKDMTSAQRAKYVDWMAENMPSFLAIGRKELFESGRSEQDDALHQRYKKDLEGIRQGDAQAIANLKRAYRKLGLDIV